MNFGYQQAKLEIGDTIVIFASSVGKNKVCLYGQWTALLQFFAAKVGDNGFAVRVSRIRISLKTVQEFLSPFPVDLQSTKQNQASTPLSAPYNCICPGLEL